MIGNIVGLLLVVGLAVVLWQDVRYREHKRKSKDTDTTPKE